VAEHQVLAFQAGAVLVELFMQLPKVFQQLVIL
jgi:hypothetical protein